MSLILSNEPNLSHLSNKNDFLHSWKSFLLERINYGLEQIME